MTNNKAHLVNRIAKDAGITIAEAKKALDAFEECVTPEKQLNKNKKALSKELLPIWAQKKKGEGSATITGQSKHNINKREQHEFK